MMRYAVIEKAGRIVIRRKPVPSVEPGKMLVRVARAGVCGATEMHFFRGETDASFPIDSFNTCFGHEGAGTIEEVGRGIRGFAAGDRIVYVGPCYTQFALVDPALAVRLPDDVLFDEILGEPFAVVLNTLDYAQPCVLADVGLIGAGFMGLLLVQGLSRMPLRRLLVADINSEKLLLAKSFGATDTVNPRESDLRAAVETLTNGSGAHVVIEASGSEDGLCACGDLAAPGGKIILHGFYPQRPSIDLATMHAKELTVINSHPHSADRYRSLLGRACAAAQEKFFDLSRIVTHRFPLDEFPDAFAALVDDPKLVKAVICVDGELV